MFCFHILTIWVNIWKLISVDIAMGEVMRAVVMLVGSDVAVASAREGGDATDFRSHVAWDKSDTVAFTSDYLDGLRVVLVVRVSDKVGNKLAKVVVDVLAVGNACDGELDDIKLVTVLGPYADVIAFVFDAEVAELLDWYIFVVERTNYHTHGGGTRRLCAIDRFGDLVGILVEQFKEHII